MKAPKLTLYVLSQKIGMCHFGHHMPIPDWAKNINFCSVTRTQDELSIICNQDEVPSDVPMFEKDWRLLKVEGPLGFSVLTGIVSSLSKPLADEEISILYIATYDTDYVLVEDKNLKKAVKILSKFCDIKE